MAERILVTGGAGFIGSFLADELVGRGHEVLIYDALVPQVHGPNEALPDYLNPDAEFIKGDVRDRDALSRALRGVDVVFHLAAAVGVGQSMYQIQHYTESNTLGGAVLLDLLANTKHQVRKILVASSMSIYGEGKYGCAVCGEVFPRLRTEVQLKARDWEMKCPHCGRDVRALPTDEDKPLFPTSIYAINYQPPVVYEDGDQTRDFIHVSDIVQGLTLAMDKPEADHQVLNLGTGVPTSVGQVTRMLIKHLADDDIEPQILNQYRAGDIRHCYADVSKARQLLGFEPRISLQEGMSDLLAWVQEQTAVDRFAQVEEELAAKSLVL
jgi:dTDP-L-rhamnose 4-epimerase